MLTCSHSSSAARKRQRKSDLAVPRMGEAGYPDLIAAIESVKKSELQEGTVCMKSGALAIGRLAIRHIAVEKAKFKSLEIHDLTVTRATRRRSHSQ